MPTRTVLQAADRDGLLARLRRLRPDSPAGWGTLDAPRMICHLADAMRIALGELPARPVHNVFSRTLGRLLVVNSGLAPPPARIKTAPEMLTTQPGAWEADVAALEELIRRVGAGGASATHPAFGPLSPAEWGRLSWKHVDHHLRQFGV